MDNGVHLVRQQISPSLHGQVCSQRKGIYVHMGYRSEIKSLSREYEKTLHVIPESARRHRSLKF